MLRWFNKPDKQPQSVSSPAYTVINKYKQRLQSLCGVTKADFQTLYVTTIDRFSDYLTEPNQAPDEVALQTILSAVVLALKKRQGYLLPLDGDSETAFREREVWTFAVFTAALFQSVDVSVRFAVVKAILPPQGFSWLHRHPTLFMLWQDYLQDKQFNNAIADIVNTDTLENTQKICQQQTIYSSVPLSESMKKPLQAETTNQTSVAESKVQKTRDIAIEKTTSKTEEEQIQVQENKPKTNQPKVIQEIDLKALSTPQNQSSSESASNKSNEASPLANAEATLPTLKAADFWRWLQQGLLREEITINETNRVVHGVESGLFIRIPEAINLFLTDKATLLGLKNSDALLTQRPALTKAIKKFDGIIRNTHGSRISTYCIGAWEKRETMSGIIIQTDQLIEKPYDLPINQALTPDPLDHA